MTPIRSCAGNPASNSPPRRCWTWSPRSRLAANPTVDPALIEAAASALDQEPAFAAEALALPGEATLADKMDVVDVDAIHAARDMARTAIGQALGDRLRATYDRLTDTAGYSIDGAAIGRRSLRNTCLSYLVVGRRSRRLWAWPRRSSMPART